MTCQFETPLYIYYSYTAAIILSFMTAFLVLFKNKKCSANWNAFYFISIVGFFILDDFLQWITRDVELSSLLYRTLILIDAGFLFFLFFSYDFTSNPLGLKKKILLTIPFFIEVPLVFTRYGIRIVDITSCEFSDGPIVYYSVLVSIFYVVISTIVLLKKYKEASFIIKYQTKIILLAIWFFLAGLFIYYATWSLTLLDETSLYFIICSLFSIFLLAFAMIKADLFDFNILPRDWFIMAIVTAIFLLMLIFSVSFFMAGIILAVYLLLMYIFWKM